MNANQSFKKDIREFYPSNYKHQDNKNTENNNLSSKKICLKDGILLAKLLSNLPFTSNDLLCGNTVSSEKHRYAFNSIDNKNKIERIISSNNGITRLFYRVNDKLVYYASILIISHRYISILEKEDLKKNHPNWSTKYIWDYLIEFKILASKDLLN
jgi:hypothetical protein